MKSKIFLVFRGFSVSRLEKTWRVFETLTTHSSSQLFGFSRQQTKALNALNYPHPAFNEIWYASLLQASLSVIACSFSSRISQPLSSSLCRPRSWRFTSTIWQSNLEYEDDNRTLQLHHLMGYINISFFFCYLFFVTQFDYSLVERTLRFKCFLQKSHRHYNLFG
jgi:hypothetical protein